MTARAYRLDLLAGLLLAVEMQLEAALLSTGASERWAVHALLLLLAAAVALRRRAPLLAFGAALGVFVGCTSMGREITDTLFAPLFLVIFMTYSAAANTDGWRFWAIAPLAFAAGAVSLAVDGYDDAVADDLLWLGLVFVAAPVVLGRLVRDRSRLQRALEAKAERLQRERAERAEEAVAAERTRIAGELHDIVAHALSEMVIQSAAAGRLAERDDDAAAGVFVAIEGRGRDALDDLRRLLGVLRRDGEAPALAPHAGPGDLDLVSAGAAAPAAPAAPAPSAPALPDRSPLGRLRALPERARDALLAAGVFVLCLVEVLLAGERDGSVALNVLAVAGLAAPLAFVRRAPMLATAAAFAVAATMTATLTGVDDLSAPFLVVLTIAYLVGATADPRTAVRGLLVVWAGICVVSTAMPDPIVGDYLFPMGFALAAWGAGRTVTHRTRLAAELQEAAVRAEACREEQAARAAAQERRRIAREMHDVIAHSVSVMVVQAAGARCILGRDPERAAKAAGLIVDTGRAALAEMRRLLGALGPADAGAGAALLAPQPTLGELEALVGRARAAGLPVALRLEGERRSLPAGLDLAAYRIVQEALTNAVKHADCAPTDVLVRWGAEDLEIVVIDAGDPRAVVPAFDAGGHGLVGMRERVQLFGGELRTGARPGGGFEVRARLPLVREAVHA